MVENNLTHKSNRRPFYALFLTPYFLLPAFVFLIVLTLYTITLAPGVVGGDAGEHQFAVPLLGIPHATGYPLYILTGKLWTILIPAGSMAWRVNLFSAVGGALAATVTALVVYQMSTMPRPSPFAHPWAGSLVGGITLAFGLTLWQWSIIAGVRSFNVFLFALITLLAIIWQQQRAQNNSLSANRTLRWLALAVGLSLAHHRTTVFYLLPLAVWIWWYDRNLILQPKRLIPLILLALAPTVLYAFIYLRGINNPPYSHERITDFQSFWFLVGASDSSGLFLSIDLTFLPARLAFIWRDVLAQISWPGFILTVTGAIILLWRRTNYFLLTGSLVLLLLLFVLDFEVVNLNEAPTWYLMPAFFIFAAWLGVGANGIWLAIQYGLRNTKLTRQTILILQFVYVVILLAALVYSLAWPNWQTIYTASTAPLDEWRQLLRGVQAPRFVEASLPYVEPNSLILGDWEQYTAYKYAQLINGQRRDVTPRLPLDNWPDKVSEAQAKGQPVYFARKTTDLIGTRYLSMAGPLIHLQTEPNFDIPPGITRLNVNFEDELELVGYRAEVIPQDTPGGRIAGPIIQVMLYWRIPQKVEWDYAISYRLIDPAGQEIYRRDATHPVLSSYPTTLWTPGEVVADFYEFPYPSGAGPLELRILPYRSEGSDQWYNLTPEGSESPGIMLGPLGEVR
jgi:hypothetical protein